MNVPSTMITWSHLGHELPGAELLQPVEEGDPGESLLVCVALPGQDMAAQRAAPAVVHFHSHSPARINDGK